MNNYKENAIVALGALNDVYYSNGSYKGMIFWDRAEMIEMIEDACEKIGPEYKVQLRELLEKTLEVYTTNWSSNLYYDDILWMCLAFIRASEILDELRYFDIAKENFDYVTNNGMTEIGVINWKRGLNQPCSVSTLTYVVCASKIYKINNDESYILLGKAQMDKLMEILYNPKNGHVYDHINADGLYNYRENACNSGLFIRACSEMYDYTGDEKYVAEIDKAASFFIGKEYNGETMCIHQSGDAAGFKAIFIRQLRYVNDKFDMAKYLEWMRLSADVAWENRNKYNLMQNNFSQKTADHRLWRAFDCQCAVVLLINCAE